jgi:amidophosphoribosyltransferase
MTLHPEYADNVALQKAKKIPYIGELFHTCVTQHLEKQHRKRSSILRQNNWMHETLIVAGNFNMTNVTELFNSLIELWSAS